MNVLQDLGRLIVTSKKYNVNPDILILGKALGNGMLLMLYWVRKIL